MAGGLTLPEVWISTRIRFGEAIGSFYARFAEPDLE